MTVLVICTLGYLYLCNRRFLLVNVSADERCYKICLHTSREVKYIEICGPICCIIEAATC